jgi:hypothetical protein
MMVAGDVGCAVWEAPWEELAGRWAGRGAAKRDEEGGLKRW